MSKGTAITKVISATSGVVGFMDAADTSTINITSSSGLASNIRNKVNIDHPFAQATSTNQPTTGSATIGGLNALGFDGVNDALVAAAAAPINNIFAAGGTAFFVLNVLSMGGASFGRVFDKTNLQLYVSNLSGSTCKLSFQQGASGTPGTWAFTNNLITLGQPFIFAVTYNSSTLSTAPKMYINSITEAAVIVTSVPTGSASSDAANALVIGNRAALDRGFNGTMGAAVFFRKVLSNEDRATIFETLSNKFGIAIS